MMSIKPTTSTINGLVVRVTHTTRYHIHQYRHDTGRALRVLDTWRAPFDAG
jgi:hypothetical protein